MLKQLFSVYSFSDPSHDINHYGPRPVVDFWQQFLPWEEISSKIVQNAKYVQPKNRVDRVKYFVEKVAVRNNLEYIAVYGLDGFLDIHEKYLRSMDFERDLIDPSSTNRRHAFLSHLEEIYEVTGIRLPTFNDHNGLYIDSGCIHISN